MRNARRSTDRQQTQIDFTAHQRADEARQAEEARLRRELYEGWLAERADEMGARREADATAAAAERRRQRARDRWAVANVIRGRWR